MILIFLLVLCAVNIRGIKEGESCTKEGVAGVCANIRVCPDALQDVQNKKAPQLCEFQAADPIVCCISALSGATVAPVVTSEESPIDNSCVTEKGEKGYCVNYYLCNKDNHTVETNGVGIFDIRARRKRYAEYTRLKKKNTVPTRIKRADIKEKKCTSYVEECCLVPERLRKTPSQDCGWRNPNAVSQFTGFNGEVSLGEFPWTVAVLKVATLIDEDSRAYASVSVYAGGGSLIHPSVAVTSARLVINLRRLRVRAGDWNTLSVDEQYLKYESEEVASIDIHESFNNKSLTYDIALLFLSSPMNLGPRMSVACLPPPFERVPGGTRCFATGWGKDKFGKEGRYQFKLKKVEVPIVNRKACQIALRTTRLGIFFELHQSFMCAGGEPDRDTCKGDGGSPLSCPIENENGRYMMSGIVSWGVGCGMETIPGIYVDVSFLRNWIDEKVLAKGFDPMTYTY